MGTETAMDWLLLIAGSVCFVEIFIRLNSLARIKDLNDLLGKVARVLRSSKISDHWKEIVLPSYALQLFRLSLLIFAILVVSCSGFLILGVVSSLQGGRFVDLSASATGIAVCTIAALAYAALRSRKSKKNSDYSILSKVLHQVSLGSPFVGEALFDIEKSLYLSTSREAADQNHVFVCGLARAGTTVLMRRLYESDEFVSLTYRDMPFVLAPNLWRKMNRFSWKSKELEERAHGDGLLVDFDSPEALEEVFWKSQCGDDYIQENKLTAMTADEETIQEFRNYVSLILKGHEKHRYLSKNNNNIIRLGSISKAFPKAAVVVPFRRPEQQAYSLMKQHQRFCELHSADRFSKKYMTWLVHHEFGSDHRPFIPGDHQLTRHDPENLNYWLEIWLQTYTYVADNLSDHTHLVCYEMLCDQNGRVWKELAERLQLDDHSEALTFSQSYHQGDWSLDETLLDDARSFYETLRTRAVGHA